MIRGGSLVIWVMAFVSSASCVGALDDPSTVRDLRVLGMRLDPPELLITQCNARTLQQILALADGGASLDLSPDAGSAALAAELFQVTSRPLDFTALIADPRGAGRALEYTLSVCTEASDRKCETSRRSVLKTGTTTAGELSFKVQPVNDLILALQDGGTPTLLEVVQKDSFRGLGGIRVPLVLELTASESGEKIYAQKLMPYSCKFVPGMVANVQPVLQGITVAGAEWDGGVGPTLELRGTEAIEMVPLDFSALEEHYVLPSLQLQPVALTESWKIAHYASSGTMSPYETGGTNLGGEESRSTFKWAPDPAALEARDIDFYFVVRDGRGGESWLTRHAHWSPRSL